MKYIIMLLIVIGLAGADFLTGFCKAYILDIIDSSKMRKGGVNKLCEIVVMGTVIGLNIGFDYLGKYYDSKQLTDIAGICTAIGVFAYIVLMELVSILENYAAVKPEAAWIRPILRRLKHIDGMGKSKNERGKK